MTFRDHPEVAGMQLFRRENRASTEDEETSCLVLAHST